jgi:autotransporter-associated beta strand protein
MAFPRFILFLATAAALAATLRSQGTTYDSASQPTVTTDYNTTGNDLTLTGAAAGTFSGLISGSGSVTKNGTGSWTLSAGNSYTGGTTVSAGSLTFSGTGDNSGVTATVASGGTLVLAKSSNSGVHAIGAVGLGLTVDAGGTAQLGGMGGDQIYDATDLVLNGTFDLAGRSETIDELSGNGTVTNTSATTTSTLTLGASNGTFSFAGALQDGAGTLALAKIGSGELTLSGASTFTGGATLGAGTLILGSSGALGASGTITLNGATLQYTAANTTDYSARFSSAAAQTYRIDTNGQNVTFASALTSADAALIKSGSGTLTLSGNNSYAGGTTLGAGTLALGSSSALGSSGTITLAGGTLQFSAANTTDYSNRFSSAAGQTYRIDTNGQNVTFASALTSSDAALVKSGSGTLTLSGNNNYGGGTTLNAGTLALGSSGALGASGTILFGGGTLQFSSANTTDYSARFSSTAAQTYRIDTNGQDISLAHVLTSSGGSLEKIGMGALTLSADNTFTGGILVSGGEVRIGAGGTSGSFAGGTTLASGTTLTFDRSDALTYSGVIGGLGAVVKTGAGALTLSGANTYTGGLMLDTGSVTLSGSDDNLGLTAVVHSGTTLALAKDSSASVHAVGAAGTGLTIDSGGTVQLAGTGDDQIYPATDVVANGTLDLAGHSESFDALTGNGTVTNTSNSTASTLTVGENHGSFAFTGALQDGAGTLALHKVGAGTLTLSTGHSYSGGTQIDGGTVVIANATGSAFGSGSVTIGPSGTLTGAGSFTGALTNNGTFSPGASPTLMTVSAFTQGASGQLILELGGTVRGTGYDALNITGAAVFDGTLTVSLLSFSPITGDSFNLFDWGSRSGTFSTLALPTLGSGLEWNTASLYTDGTISVQASAVPEPSTYAAIVGAIALGLALWRRRRPAEAATRT